MKSLYNAGGKKLIENTFKNIREPFPDQPGPGDDKSPFTERPPGRDNLVGGGRN